MEDDQLEELKEALENNNDGTERRSLLNPMYWIGLCFLLTGFLFCLTIIGLPLGIPMIIGGRKWMYKNNDIL